MNERGSEKLLQQWKGRAAVLPDDLIKDLGRVLEGVEILGLSTKGQPNPDSIRLAFEVSADDDSCGTMTNHVVHLGTHGGTPIELRWFPRGIPQINRVFGVLTAGPYGSR